MEKRLKFKGQYSERENLLKVKFQKMKNMKKIEEIKNRLEELKPILKEKFKAKSIGVFGSYIKGEEKKGSDLDILVEFEESASLSLLDFIGLENFLGEELGVKVDLVEKSTLKPRIGKHILEEVVYV
jgi:predicted nucleotidyltransferase